MLRTEGMWSIGHSMYCSTHAVSGQIDLFDPGPCSQPATVTVTWNSNHEHLLC